MKTVTGVRVLESGLAICFSIYLYHYYLLYYYIMSLLIYFFFMDRGYFNVALCETNDFFANIDLSYFFPFLFIIFFAFVTPEVLSQIPK